MNINRDNYEAYFLDFAEGRLSAEQEEMVDRFLKFNPDLEEELKTFSHLKIEPGHIEFPFTEKMKREMPGDGDEVTDSNFDMYCVAAVEDDLNPETRKKLEAYLLAHPDQQEAFNLYQATKLPLEEITFPNRKQLKKRAFSIQKPVIWSSVAAAAAISLLIIFGPDFMEPTPEIASVKDPVEEKQAAEENVTEEETMNKPSNPVFNVKRKSSNPVPPSTYKKPEVESFGNETENENEENNYNESGRIAGIQLKKVNAGVLVEVPYDRLKPQAIAPPAVNSRSLSILELARYQASKASELINDDEVSILSLANSGLQEINRITGTEAQIRASRDEDGSISGIQFKSRFLNFMTPVSRDD